MGLQGCQGRGPRGFRYSISRQIQGYPHALFQQFPKTQAYLPQSYPAPTPKLQQPPRTLVREAQAAALPIRLCWRWGSCLPPPTPFPFPTAVVIHFPNPTYGQGSRLLGDAHLFWKAISRRGSKMFSSGSHVLYLASEKGAGEGEQSVKKKKKARLGNDIRPYVAS